MTKAIPDGYHSVTPYLVVQGAPKLIDFMKQAFDANKLRCTTHPSGDRSPKSLGERSQAKTDQDRCPVRARS